MENEAADKSFTWDNIVAIMTSGSPESLILWAILGYGVWATFNTAWRDHDGGLPWHRKDPNALPRKWYDWRRRD